MSADIWGVFHDGSIEALGRPAPSVVQVRISLLYLREMFAGAGDAFLVTLHGCSCFRYRPFEGEPLDDLSAIALAALEILSVDRRPQLVLLCSAGEIDLAYDRWRWRSTRANRCRKSSSFRPLNGTGTAGWRSTDVDPRKLAPPTEHPRAAAQRAENRRT